MKRLAAMFSVVLFLNGEPDLSGSGPEAKPKEATSTSPFGPQVDGLRCRVTAPREIEQGMPLNVDLEFEVDRTAPPAHAKRLNAFLIDGYVMLSLKDKKTGKELNVEPYDPTRGMLAVDSGTTTLPLDGSALKPISIRLPLLPLYEALTPGEYECRVQYSFTDPKWWRGGKIELQKAAFWKGTIRSGVFPLTVHKEPPRDRAFHVPKQLRLEKGLEVRFKKEDAEQVALPVRNGHFIGTKIYRGDVGHWSSLQGGTPIPGDVNTIDRWLDYKGGDRKMAYTIEIFETAAAPRHFWHSAIDDAKVLWKKTFVLDFTEKEIRQKE